MTKRTNPILLAVAACVLAANFATVDSFAINRLPQRHAWACPLHPTRVTSHGARKTSLNMIDVGSVSEMLSSASTFLSTIDSDIEKIPTNEFGTVFAGGLVVMFGGVISALVVGGILEARGSYASVVADSYSQDLDADFLQKLSPDERDKAEELIQKIKDSKNKEKGPKKEERKSEKKEGEKSEEMAMFSDYDDE